MLYNKERKELFLNQYTENEASVKVIRSRFNQIGKYERHFDKDLCDFTTELDDLFSLIPSRTTKSIMWLYSIIKNYCNWCIANGFSKTNINPTFMISNKDLESYVNKIAQKFQWIINREELYEMCELLYNPRDKATLALVFEGVKGRANLDDSFEELLNLKNEHIHEKECEIEVYRNDGFIRMVSVHPKTMEYVIEAINATDYYEGNGEHPKNKVTPLTESNYFLRPIKTKRSAFKPNRTIINNIFRIIKKYTDMPFLNPLKTFQSGMLVACMELEEEKGSSLETEDYFWVATKKFGQLDSVSYSLKQLYMKFKELVE